VNTLSYSKNGESRENRKPPAATDSALLNVIDYKLKHNKNDMMTLRFSSDDKKMQTAKKNTKNES
jgi:hypothetical protein